MDASKNAVATHDAFGPRPSDWDTVGSAVLTTLPSKAESRMGMQSPVKHLQNPTPRAHTSLVSSTDPFSSGHWRVVDDEDVEMGDWQVNEVSSWGLAANRALAERASHLSVDLGSIAAGRVSKIGERFGVAKQQDPRRLPRTRSSIF